MSATPAKPATRHDLMQRLEALAITTSTLDHAPVFTVAESHGLEAQLEGAHTKNLFLKCKKGQLYLVVAKNDTQIDLKSLHKVLGSGRLSFGKPELLMEVLGVIPGSVTPFALVNDKTQRVSVFLDARMMALDPLNFHPLQNDATTTIARDDLITFIEACGHAPTILDVGEAP
ncbi:MAG: prolyl-tRNA synthetase associated domain-containing protein [Pseudomonadota bacterium]